MEMQLFQRHLRYIASKFQQPSSYSRCSMLGIAADMLTFECFDCLAEGGIATPPVHSTKPSSLFEDGLQGVR